MSVAYDIGNEDTFICTHCHTHVQRLSSECAHTVYGLDADRHIAERAIQHCPFCGYEIVELPEERLREY